MNTNNGMTIKEIAELCGVSKKTVVEWAMEAAKNYPSIAKKIKEAEQEVADIYIQDEINTIIHSCNNTSLLDKLKERIAQIQNSPALQKQTELQTYDNTVVENELAPINLIEQNGALWVDARELHKALGVGKDFSTWIKKRIDNYNFQEDSDFYKQESLSSPKLGSSKSRAQKTMEYSLTLNMAKELAMVENNEQGRAIRKYFIAIENQSRHLVAMAADYGGLENVLQIAAEQKITEALNKSRAMDKDKLENLRRYLMPQPQLTTMEMAKLLDISPETVRKYTRLLAVQTKITGKCGNSTPAFS